MADTAEFTLALIDKVSSPANKIALKIIGIHDRVESLIALFRAVQYVRTGELRADLARTGNFIKETVVSLAAKMAVGGAAAAAYAYALTKGVVSMGVYAESSRRALGALTGSMSAGEDAFRGAVLIAKELGLNVETTVDSFKHLLAMQFSVAEASELVKVSADLQAVTGSAESAHRAITAITQIKAKGRLQAEELVGQLAEAGVSTVLVYKELGKILGKDTDAVRKMITAGEIDADTGITAIKRAIMTKLHESRPGEAARAFATGTLSGLMQQLQNAPGRLFVRLADAARVSLMKLGPVVKEITNAIDQIDTREIADFVSTMLDMARGAVVWAKEFVFAFMDGTKEINDEIKRLTAGENALKLARELGRLFASGAAFAIKIVGYIASIAVYLNDHRWIVYTVFAIYLLGKLMTVAFMVTHALTIMGASLWIWRTFHLGPLILQTIRWTALLARAAWGVNLIRTGLLWVGRIMLRQLVIAPLIAAGWIGAIILVAGLVIFYWDEICEAFSMGVRIMQEELARLWTAFVEVATMFSTGELWSDAGAKAGSAFVDAFKTALWNHLRRFVPGLAAMESIYHAEAQAFGLEGKQLSPEDRKLFATDTAVASTAPAAGQSDEAIMRMGTADEVLQHLRKKGDLHIGTLNVNVQSDGTDPKAHGKAAAEGVEKELRSHWSILSTEFGGG